jgi:uncharacterized protein YggU (UPF0235/DUF167 family)
MTTLRIKVKPGGRTAFLELRPDGAWLASVKSPPVDGKANKELIGLISARFHCPKSAVSVIGGAGARLKLVRIADA